MAGLGGVTYLVAAPVLHAVNQPAANRARTVAGSLGIRLAGATLGALIGSRLEISNAGNCNAAPAGTVAPCEQRTQGGWAGLLIGAAAASIVDGTLVARATVPAPAAAPGASLQPIILPRGSAIAPQGATGLAVTAHF